MATIKLSNTDRVTLVDDDMFEELNKYSWNLRIKKGRNTDYVARPIKLGEKQSAILIHRFILNLKKGDGQQVDHINGNGLDNRLVNLRICTHQQNQCNSGLQKNNTSGYKGVHWRKDCSKWYCCIYLNGKPIYLGRFECKIEAAKVYNEAAVKYYGEFARLNKV